MPTRRNTHPTVSSTCVATIAPGGAGKATRREAQATNAQLQALQALADTALSHLVLNDLLRELLDCVAAVMGADHVAILLVEEDGRTLTVRAARGLLAEAVDRVQMPLEQGLAGRTAASQVSLIGSSLANSSDLDCVHPLLCEWLHSAVAVPLLTEDPAADLVTHELQCQGEGHLVSRLMGMLTVESTAPHHLTEVDVQALQRVADRVAPAIGRARRFAAEQDARRRAEAALARAQASKVQAIERAEQLHTILETMADGVAVYDAEGRPIQLVNRAYRELLALERGPAGYDALTTRERVALLDLRDAITGAPLLFDESPVGRALRGEVVTGPSADVRARAFDGRELEVNNSAMPLRDGNGRIVGVVVLVRDMTERNRLARDREAARVQAERQAEQLDRIFETAADGLVVWDAEGRMVRVNPAARRILGLDAAPPEFTQLPLGERFARYAMRDEHGRPLPSEEWPGVRTLHTRVATGRETGTEPEAHVIRLRALDGREREVHDSTAPLRDRDGQLVGAVCVMHDVTERNRLARERARARADELAAREASRRMEAFVATAAHDLRTPLSATVGYLDLAEHASERLATAARSASPEDLMRQIAAVRDRLDEASQSAQRLAQLLARLFDTAAIRAGKLDLRRAPCDLAALVREQVAGLRVAMPDRTLRLHLPGPAGRTAGDEPIRVIPVEADADRLGQVVANYVTNALKYAPPDRPIDVAVEVHGGRARVARVTVRDQGPGIPPEERARVWELFHRAPDVTAHGGTPSGVHGGSLGLGLYICKAIIEAHGGQVGVKSAVGEGTTFWFTLPLSLGMTRRERESA